MRRCAPMDLRTRSGHLVVWHLLVDVSYLLVRKSSLWCGFFTQGWPESLASATWKINRNWFCEFLTNVSNIEMWELDYGASWFARRTWPSRPATTSNEEWDFQVFSKLHYTQAWIAMALVESDSRSRSLEHRRAPIFGRWPWWRRCSWTIEA